MDKYKAELLGYIAGDGNLSSTENRVVYVSNKTFGIDYFKFLIKKVYGKQLNQKITYSKKLFRISFKDEKICNDLKNEFENKWLHKECRMPKSIRESTLENKCAFIRALYSDDGSIFFYYNNTKSRLSLSLTSLPLILDVKKVFEEIGINKKYSFEKHFFNYGNLLQYKIDLESLNHLKIFEKYIGFDDYSVHKNGLNKKIMLNEAICRKEIKAGLK